MQAQTERALADADVALLRHRCARRRDRSRPPFCRLAAASGKPVVVVANKTEGRATFPGVGEAYRLGLGDPVPISAEHGEGLAELYERLAPFAAERSLPQASAADAPAKPLHLAIVGRPNVGKSTLVNRLIGEERLLTGPEAGITRDAIAVDWTWRGRPIRLVDTAGMRRRPRVEGKIEQLSVADALRAIRFAETVVLVLDALAAAGAAGFDDRPAGRRGGPSVGARRDQMGRGHDGAAALKQLRDRLSISLPQLHGVALVPVSGLTGYGLEAMMDAVVAADAVWNRRIRDRRS